MSDELPLSTSDIRQEVKIRLGMNGIAALPPKTIMQSFDATVKLNGDKPALHQKKVTDGKLDTKWTTYTWKEYRKNVDDFAKSLLSIGFDRFDTINIIGFNAPEWLFANFGAIAAGGVSAGIYTTNSKEACQYISEHSKARVVVCEGVQQLEKYYDTTHLLNLKALVMYGPDKLPADIKGKCRVPCYTFDEFVKLGASVSDADLKARSDSWSFGETCSLIYTSGTTGPPKAVMITNDNITWTVETMLLATRKGTMDTSDVMVSYLPLSHVAAQMIDMYLPNRCGSQIYFAQPDALKGSLAQTLKDVRPTTFFGVPRVWEKFHERLQQVAKSSSGIKRILSNWAKAQALADWKKKEYGSSEDQDVCGTPNFSLFLAKKLLHKVHAALGFDRCYAFYVAAAPIELKVMHYFASLDIPIMEIFGQSECTGPQTTNTYTAFKFGTCGRPLLGTETMLDKQTGELCYRGRHIFAGYWGMPEKTNETIDAEGWLRSGDVATMDGNNDQRIPEPSGFMRITGRIKELIITSGGENVAPVPIEENLKEVMPALSNVMVIGDKRKFLSAVLALQVEVGADCVPTNKLTGEALDIGKQIGSTATTTDEVRNDPAWKTYFDNGIKAANEKAISRAQKVNKWLLLPSDFSEKGGELTPTLKLKRSIAAEKYSDMIEAIYT
ncbi:decanoate-CoA ligase [Mayamaea pseudoterrestris]|nr:decanoate-CoA ligase [Mayamaea pseudoterrestris]